MRTGDEIRQDFITYFKEQQHAVVPSASLVPAKDPSLLFTNSGMVQFKDVFLGTDKRNYTRAVDSQKCMRVAGKHNDLDDVGRDGTHHTFFEMLGNWSFGDYYKQEAIQMAWTLLTEVWQIPPNNLYVTVFKDEQGTIDTDEEAASDTQWDIGFKRTSVFLNTHQETPVSLYFTGNNADFFDDEGNAIADSFLNATVDSELDDYLAVTASDIPDDTEFSTDSDSQVIGTTFYNYDTTTHVVSAAEDVYYIVSSDDNYTKFNVTDIVTEGYGMGEISLTVMHQSVLDGQTEFATSVQKCRPNRLGRLGLFENNLKKCRLK